MVRLFADTYALIELLKGNPNYESYSDVELVSTEFENYIPEDEIAASLRFRMLIAIPLCQLAIILPSRS